MGKIATWSDVNSKIGTSGSPSSKCPTKNEILATDKAVISGSYSTQQLVDINNITKKRIINTYTGRWASSEEYQCDLTYAADKTMTFELQVKNTDSGYQSTISGTINAGSTSGIAWTPSADDYEAVDGTLVIRGSSDIYDYRYGGMQ